VRRREFVTLVGGAAAWPLCARTQPAQVRSIAVLMGTDENDPVSRSRLEVFRNALAELGWTASRNARFEIRWAGGNPARMRVHQELHGRRCAAATGRPRATGAR
jgi:putative ABC transport system substrate-binding protein